MKAIFSVTVLTNIDSSDSFIQVLLLSAICVLSNYRPLLGVELLKQFKAEVDQMEAERQELGNAEKLFDLPITVYPDLQQIQKEMKGLEQIYALYEEQKVSEILFRYQIIRLLIISCRLWFKQGMCPIR